MIDLTARNGKLWLLCTLLLAAALPASAQDDAVRVTALKDPVDKSYRRMASGAELFEKRRAVLAPEAVLRFRLLPRKPGTDLADVDLRIVGESFEEPLEVAPDGTFALPRDARAQREDASVQPNRKKLTMTWRAEVRTPGFPPGTRRLGDLRLECEVGMQAGLVSNPRPSLIGALARLVEEGPEYCYRPDNRYLFFADRALWRVTLVHGERRAALPLERLYAGASKDPNWQQDLRYCDCEVLVGRSYFLPLGDASWPDDTRVEFEYMDGLSAGIRVR